MDWEILIPLLMFAFPVVVSLLDKRAKRKRAASTPPVSRPTSPVRPAIPPFSRQSVPPGPLPRHSFPPVSQGQAGGGVAPGNRATLGTVRGGTASEAQRWGPAQPDVSGGKPRHSLEEEIPVEEGVRAIHREETKKAPGPVQPADKLQIDKKKLIIYSEILQPKFDA